MKEIVSAPTAHREMTPVEVVAVGLVIFGAFVALAGYRYGLCGSLIAVLAILAARIRDRPRGRK